jgi:hypothetical protein
MTTKRKNPTTEQREKTIREVIRLKTEGKTDEQVAEALAKNEELYSYAPKTVWRKWKQYRDGQYQEADSTSDSVNVTPEGHKAVTPTSTSEEETLKKMNELLKDIQATPRPVGATGKGKYTTLKTKMIAARLPVALAEELEALEGPKSGHIERAVKLYLKVLKAGE